MRNRSFPLWPRPLRRLGMLGVVAGLMFSGLAAAQPANTTLLKGADVTESNLVDALTPSPAPQLTRSLRVSPDTSPSAEASRKKASASLLITFVTNSSALTPRSKEQLDVVAAALRNERLKDYSFEIEGHADPRGTHDANMILSQQRAESARSYLVSAQNIPQSRLRAVGKGDTVPLNTKDAAAPENRRVTINTVTQ